MRNKLLLMFSKAIFKENEINLVKLDEQLQIAIQILLNKDYEVLVSGDDDRSFEFAKKFSYIFQHENIKNTEDKLDDLQKFELIKNSDCIICFEEEVVQLAKDLHRIYIFIDVEAKSAGEKNQIEGNFEAFTIDNLNAGEFVKRVEELISSESNLQKEQKGNYEDNSNDEFEEYKKQIKKTIEQFINNNELEEAKNLISEYESIVKYDMNIYSMKAVIAIMENDLEMAETMLLQGYKIQRNNFDILYNLGYLYDTQNNTDLASYYYKKAILNSQDTKIQESIYETLKAMGEKSSLKSILRGNAINSTSIIILTYNNLEYNKICIESIKKYTKPETYEIIVVDNNSTDGTKEWLKDQKDIKVILNSENVGFPKGCNIGIEVAKLKNDILLLNNDTIVTPNWLDNLKKCLYSDNMIGAVGAVTNNCSYYQAISVNYKDIDEMINFSEKFNVSDSSKWEQRIKLVGFCMLIKGSVVDKIGLLDERFTPGNFEDDDYSYRIQEAGYKLYLCNDTFIHHFGSTSFKKDPEKYNKLLTVNAEKFKEKWGFSSLYSSFIRNEIIEQIDHKKDDAINVLEIGCACGATLLKIKTIYKNAQIYGIELDGNAAKIAKKFADVRSENIENIKLSYEEEFFDYIIFADVLEHLYDPWKALNNMKKYLQSEGKVLASIPNVMNYTVVKGLLNGNWTYENSGILDTTHIRFFTLSEINKLFLESGYLNMKYSATTLNISKNDEEFINNLCKITGNNDKQQYLAYQYIIKAEKTL